MGRYLFILNRYLPIANLALSYLGALTHKELNDVTYARLSLESAYIDRSSYPAIKLKSIY